MIRAPGRIPTLGRVMARQDNGDWEFVAFLILLLLILAIVLGF